MTKFAAALLLLAAFPVAANASGPQAPCGAIASPAFSVPGAAPAIGIYHPSDIATWRPAACVGWPADSAAQSKLVVAVAGSFQFNGSIDSLLARVGAVSSLSKVQYWSTTEGLWRPLAYDASALKGPSAKDRRSDFTASELGSGAQLYYWENDSRSGEVVTRLSVRERSPAAVVIGTENVTPIRRFMITLFPPGALQTVLFVKRISPDIWGVYLLSRTSGDASMLADGHDGSYVNRAVALYRQIAAIRTDQEPPAAR